MQDNLELNSGNFTRRWIRQDEPESGDRDGMKSAKCRPTILDGDGSLEDEPERFVAFCD